MSFSSESVKNKKNKESNTYQKYNFSKNVFFIINFGPILKDLSQNFVFRHFPPFTIFAQLCKIIPCCISPHQKTELHKSSQSLICQVTQDHPYNLFNSKMCSLQRLFKGSLKFNRVLSPESHSPCFAILLVLGICHTARHPLIADLLTRVDYISQNLKIFLYYFLPVSPNRLHHRVLLYMPLLTGHYHQFAKKLIFFFHRQIHYNLWFCVVVRWPH